MESPTGNDSPNSAIPHRRIVNLGIALTCTLLSMCSALAQTETRGIQTIAAGNTAFAKDFYEQLKNGHDENIFVSPLSLSAAFALAYAGAKGETAAEIASVLRFDGQTQANFHLAMSELLDGLKAESDDITLSINNALFTDRQLVLEEDYEALIKRHYGRANHRVDFARHPDAAVDEINAWVEDKTNQRIQDVLAADAVTTETRAVLINTIFLDAKWQLPFAAESTIADTFQLLGGGEVAVPMMRQVANYRHWQNRLLQAILLPYRENRLSMVILLPKKDEGLTVVEARLGKNLEKWLTALAAADMVEVDLKQPKLQLNHKYSLVKDEGDIVDNVLPRMGMLNAFTNAADFSGAVRPDRQSDEAGIKIDDVIHQTFIEVDEAGTEAAAATAMAAVRVTSARIPPPPPPIPFHADHPFLFLIQDDATGLILFMGRVVDPTG